MLLLFLRSQFNIQLSLYTVEQMARIDSSASIGWNPCRYPSLTIPSYQSMYRTPDEAMLLRRLGLSCGMSGLLKLLKVGRESLSLQVVSS